MRCVTATEHDAFGPINKSYQALSIERSTMKKTILIVALASIVLVAIAGVGLYFFGILPGNVAVEQTAVAAEAPVPPNDRPPIYVRLDPAFTISFTGDDDVQFLQLKIEVATYDSEVEEALTLHMPAIRNALIMLFTSQKSGDLISREGKEALRQKTLEEIQLVLEKSTGKKGVNDVFFTSFVMQ